MSENHDDRARELEEALQKVESDNPYDRSAAVARLGQLREGLDALRRATSDRNGYVRAAAAEALGAFESDDVALYLGDLLFDKNPYVRSASVRSLGRVGATRYVPALVDLLDDTNPHIRAAALRALSDLRVEQAAPALLSALDDPHRKIRLDAARGLRQLADPTTRDAMVEVVLDGIGDARPDLPFLNTLIQAIAATGSADEVGPLLVRLVQEAVGCRTVAARALRPLGFEPARPTLERALTDRNPNLRLAALQTLDEMGLGPSIVAVRGLLADEDSRVQRAACRALARAEDAEALPILRELAYSPNPFLRPCAIEGMAILDPEGSLPLFLELLDDNNIAVREAVIVALEPRSEDPEVRGALTTAREREVSDRIREQIERLLAGGSPRGAAQ